MRKFDLLLALSLVICVVLACNPMKGKNVAEPAVARFHQQYNDGKDHEIYLETDAGFKANSSEKDLTDILGAMRRKLGNFKKADSTGWFVNSTTQGTMVTLSYDVEFADGKGTEKFVYLIDGDQAKLFNYNINAPTLITK